MLVMLLYWTLLHGYTRPDVPPPENSKNVRFYSRSGWQLLRYYYRIDNEPEISIEFAKELMNKARNGPVLITTEEFTSFPISSNFPSWLNPNSVTDETLITGDDWIYAVVDNKTGRMFYYNGH